MINRLGAWVFGHGAPSSRTRPWGSSIFVVSRTGPASHPPLGLIDPRRLGPVGSLVSATCPLGASNLVVSPNLLSDFSVQDDLLALVF